MFSWNFATFLRTTFFYRTPSVAASEKKTWNYLAQIHEDSFQGVLGNDSTENFRDPLTTQLTFYLFKVTILTLEKGVKYVDVVLVVLLFTLNIFYTFY